jgi:hypothetical protein
MDWRRLEAARAPAPRVALAELRPSIHDLRACLVSFATAAAVL